MRVLELNTEPTASYTPDQTSFSSEAWYPIAVVTGGILIITLLLHGASPSPASTVTGASVALLTAALSLIAHRRARRAMSDLVLTAARARTELAEWRNRSINHEKLTSLGILAVGVAHEINNPMSYVTSNVHGLAEELRAHPDLPAPLREYVEDLLPSTLDGIQRVNAIVADLRAFAREDAGQPTLFDLNEQIEAALRIAHGHLREKVTVEKNFGKLTPAYGRPQQITQVLVNLLVNAAQAIPMKGLVTITTQGDPEGLHVEVKDTGAGMAPETLAHLFKPFFTTKPAGVGTGLGLSVAHSIIRRHGGRIDVKSKLGAGSTFIIHLPRCYGPLRTDEEQGSARRAKGHLRNTENSARLDNEPAAFAHAS